ncbi:MAG: DoxX family membrane protein [Bdellovibrionaceae bacterium]|jgi:thiosulfate dehydrogenase [quinone] large subunit|nr:DoxX family membrane protein [Pseudobdellovibrionaceae bacterium]
MWVSFFESVKYTGHLFPISFLRIFLGALYFQQGLEKLNGDFLTRPRLAEQISNWLPASSAPAWYKYFIGNQIIPHWQTAAFIILGLELAIGISYILGYVVRPMALVAVLLCFNLIFFYGPASEELLKIFVAVHFVLAWVGAGRCLGFDYYFFKRRRGIWW